MYHLSTTQVTTSKKKHSPLFNANIHPVSSLVSSGLLVCQQRNVELEKVAASAQISASEQPADHLQASLGRTVGALLDSIRFSDIEIEVGDSSINAHKLVLASRGVWTDGSLDALSTLRLEDVDYITASAMFKWVYTDHLEEVDPQSEDEVAGATALLRASVRFQLATLKLRCEANLISAINVSNCVHFLTVAHEMEAPELKK